MATDDDEEEGASGASPAAPSDAGTPAPAAPSAAPATGGGGVPSTLPAPSLDSMVVSPQQLEATRRRLVAIQQAKTANDAAQAGAMTAQLDKDRARLNAKYDAIGTDMPQAWDANKKTAEHYTDPVQAFGSVGSVFAMLASSFAGLPMEAGLNAGAAAINAIHQGDEKAYNREFETWEKNTTLALKRHEIERQSYNDALTLMNSNINAGRTKMELAATKFGDQKALALLENGMDKELTDLFVSRNKAAVEMQDQWDKVQLQHDKVTDLRSDPRYTSGNPELKNQAITEWTQRWAANSSQKLRYDAKADYIAAQKRANPNWTPDDMIKWNTEFADAGGGSDKGGMKSDTPDKLAMNKFIQEHAGDNGGAGASAEDIAAFKQKLRASGGGGKANSDLTEDRQRAAYIAKVRDEKVAGGTSYEQAVQEARVAADKAYPPKLTSAQAGRYQDRVFMADQTLDTVGKQLDRLEKYVGVAGAPGYVTRAAEKVGNVLGKTEAERQEFAKDTDLLRLNAARMLTLSQGRPLAAEASRINNIIKGIGIGDTAAATAAALRDYKKFVEDFKRDAAGRLGGVGGANPEGIGASGGAAKSSGTPRWQQAPIVAPAAGPRSDIASEEAYG